jgi:hypothetical protein
MMVKGDCPTEEQVRARAYQLYRARGSQPGHEVDDWLQAEYELIQLPIRKIAELHPSRPGRKDTSRLAVVSLVQAALLLGAETLTHVK